VTLDSSAIFALLNRKDLYHLSVKQVLMQNRPPFIISTPTVAEIVYLIENRLGHHVVNALVADIEAGLFRLDYLASDLTRAKVLANQYLNLPLGLTDALIIACAERNGGTVLSLDKHFFIVAGEGKINLSQLYQRMNND
jgi:uncharacterized protein